MRRFVAVITAVLIAITSGVIAPPAVADLHNLRIGLTGEPIMADDLLTVTGTSDLRGGEVCIVAVDSSAETCDSPAWGTPNQILTIGTFIEHPIEAPPLQVGRWKVIAVDRGRKTSESVFEVMDCGSNCNPAGAVEAMLAWKESAAQQLPFHGAVCVGAGTLTIGRDAFKGFQGIRNLVKNIKHIENDIARLKNAKDALSDSEWRSRMSDLLKAKSNAEKLLKPALMAATMDASRGAMGGIFQQMRDGTDSAWGGYVNWYNAFDVVKGSWWATTSAWTAGKILANINCRAALMYSDIVADPPDYAYDTVAQPVFLYTETDLPEDEPLAELIRATDQAQAYGTASRIAVERLQGAQEHDDAAGIRRQASAAAEFNRLLSDATARQAVLLDEVAATADTHDVWSGSRRDSLTDLDQWQRRAATGEITGEERATLATEYNLTDEEIDQLGEWQAEWAPDSFPSVEERWAAHADYVADVRANGFDASEIVQLQELGATEAMIEDLRIQVAEQNTDPAQLDAELTDRMRGLADALRAEAWPMHQFTLWLEQVAAGVRTPVTPERPVINFITTCGEYGSVELPTVEGLTYTQTPAEAREGRVTVRATALPGYVIADGEVSVWNINLGTYERCQAEAIIAADATVEVPKDRQITFDVGQLITTSSAYSVAIATSPANGSASRSGATGIVYRPRAGFVGTDTFTYRATVTNAPTLSDTGTITVTVTEELVEVTPLPPTFTQITQCNQYGSVVLPTTPGVSYAADPAGAREGEVTVTATAAAGYVIAPDAVSRWVIPLGTYVACEDHDVTANDTDTATRRGTPVRVDLGALVQASGAYSLRVVTQPSNGSVPYVQSPSTFEYRPRADFVGTDSFRFRATLNADSSVWAEGTVTITVVDVNDPPVVRVRVTPPVSVAQGASLSNPYTISDPNNDALTYEWRASTGATATSTNPGNLGFVDPIDDGWVELTVTDAHGAVTEGERVPVVVTNVAPRIDGTLPVRAVPGVEAVLELGIVDPGPNDEPQLTWDLGDGTTATGTQIRHTWEAGTYQLRVTATDKHGGTQIRTATVQVAPTVVDAGPDLTGLVNQQVTFDFSGSTPADPWLIYETDSGDGVFRRNQSSFRYTTPGDYTVTLRATDARDGDRQLTDTIQVKIRQHDVAVVAHVLPGTVAGGTAEVRASVYDRSTWTALPDVEVTFTIDGHVLSHTTDTHGQATARLPIARTGAPGTATVAVVDDGLFGGDSVTVDIERQTKPAADIVFSVDESGSMGGAQAAVRSQLTAMATQLAPSLDYTFGIWGFPSGHGASRAHLHWPLTTELEDFSTGVNELYTSGGGSEWGTDAVVQALDPISGWRPGAARCVVLVADEALQSNQHSAEDVAAALTDTNATLFTITTPNVGAGYKELAEASGGADFDITAFVGDPQPVMEALLESCQRIAVERPDLSVEITDGVDSVEAGLDQAYEVTVSNNGPALATGVVLSVELPAELTRVAPAGEGVLELELPDLGPGEVWTGRVVARSALSHEGGAVEVSAEVHDDGASGADPTPEDNQSSDTTVITPARPDLAITVDSGHDAVTLGQEHTYVLSVTNNGRYGATGVVAAFVVPDGVSVVDADGASGSDLLTWDVGALAAGADWTRTVVLRIALDYAGDGVLVRAEVRDDSTRGEDPTPADNVDTDATPVAGPSPSPSPSESPIPSESPSPSPSPSPSSSPSTSPSPSPSSSPSMSPSPSPTSSRTPSIDPKLKVYVTPGYHVVNGRKWFTQCEPYSQTSRCWSYIWATFPQRVGSGYAIKDGWLFNNLTYLPMKRAMWSQNPLGNKAEWIATTDGRPWRTQCDTPATGRGACRSEVEISTLTASPLPGGGHEFKWVKKWVFNNMVLFDE